MSKRELCYYQSLVFSLKQKTWVRERERESERERRGGGGVVNKYVKSASW